MQINNLLNTGVQGFQTAVAQADNAAQKIARQSSQEPQTVANSKPETVDSGDLIASLRDLMDAEIQAKANAKVIQAGGAMTGALLDALA